MLDLKKWFDSKHYMRLWNVGPPGFLFSLATIHGLHHAEQAFSLKTFSLSSGWFFALVALTALDALVLLFWVLFSLPPKNRGIKLSKKGIYGLIRHPIYTAIVYHLPILCALSWGSFFNSFVSSSSPLNLGKARRERREIPYWHFWTRIFRLYERSSKVYPLA